MRQSLVAVAVLCSLAPSARATGLLIPVEKKVPPLALVSHKVDISIKDQVAVTRVEQVFHNHTDRQLEATYVFPVPKGASVRKFSMWVDGKEVPGELVEAAKAREIYTSIVQRTQDPGLLEYIGNDVLRLRVFPILPRQDQKIAVTYTSITTSDNGLIEYVYPLKSTGKAVAVQDKFSIKVQLESQHALQNIYSPSHAITMTRPNDREAVIGFEKDQALLDRDFQLFYMAGQKDVGVTALTHRPIAGQDGYFMFLLSPRAELSKSQQVPRDMVFVLDSSGSMRGKRIVQAKAALNYCLKNLNPGDRFAILHFATTINRYSDKLLPVNSEQIGDAVKWVNNVDATGGTAINDALRAALDMRPNDAGRTFTIVFFTDGQPTIGETNPERILANVKKQNNANTRIFTFGVGDDVNAALLDQLADNSKAISTYVRESEDIEAKVSSLYNKIANPVLANLKLSVGEGIKISEVYPPELPDLFHGSQLVVLGRYTGKGHAAVKLTGSVGMETREFVYELNFPEKSSDGKAFVEDLWARRKVGYLLDQIRLNGQKQELVDEVVALAKRYGIATPYTSYLIVPDAVPTPVAVNKAPDGKPNVSFDINSQPPVPPALVAPGPLGPKGKAKAPLTVEGFLKQLPGKDAKTSASGQGKGGAGGIATARDQFENSQLDAQVDLLKKYQATAGDKKDAEKQLQAVTEIQQQKRALDLANQYFAQKNLGAAQTGNVGVNLAMQNNALRFQERLTKTASRLANQRNCIEVGGVWIDEAFDSKMPTVTIKAQSNAYFRILARHPAMKDVFALGNHIVWVTPSGTALIIDQGAGTEEMTDADIDRLFVVPGKK